jgi:hypothetical protein
MRDAAATFHAFSSLLGVQSGSKFPLLSLEGEDFMSQKTFSLVVGLIFLPIAIMHV